MRSSRSILWIKGQNREKVNKFLNSQKLKNMKFNEWIVILNGKRIDNKGYFCSAQCVTAYSKKEALRILSKAKMYYFGSYRLNPGTKKNTYIKMNFCTKIYN